MVLEIECANQLRLFDDRQTHDGSGALPPHILVLRIQVAVQSIIKDHALPRPDNVMKHGFGQIRWRDGYLSNGDFDSAVAGGALRHNLQLVAPEKDNQTSLGPCMLDRDRHEPFDELPEFYLIVMSISITLPSSI